MGTLPDRWFRIEKSGGWHIAHLYLGDRRNGQIEQGGNPRFAVRTLAVTAARTAGYPIERDNEDGVQDDE